MQNLKYKEYKEAISSDKCTIIDFWASWCGPCKMIAPNFEKVSEKLSGKCNFAKVNVDDEEKIAIENHVYSIPTMIIFKGGKEIARRVGYAGESELEDFVNNNCK